MRRDAFVRAFVASIDRARLDAASRASACDRAVEGAVEVEGSEARALEAANEGSGGEGWSYRCIMIKRRAVIMCAVMCAFGRACR